MKLRVFTAFSGYDSQCLALDRLKQVHSDFDYELVGWSEIDKYAIQAHNALFPHWSDRNYGDISKIDWNNVPNFDLFTYSFPCQDISLAGLQKGFTEGSGTRSSLLWECEKAIKIKRPKYLILENVKALVNKKNTPQFNKWLDILSSYGYTNYWKVLNARDYGVPQNRERVFVVSILGEKYYIFPKKIELKLRLKDILEVNVPEKYYLSDKKYDSNCLTTVQKDNLVLEPRILTPKRTDFGKRVRRAYENGDEYYHRSDMTALEPRKDDVSNCLTSVQKDNLVLEPRVLTSIFERFGKAGGCVTSDRVQKMMDEGKIPQETCFIDAYNGATHNDIACTVRALDRGIHFVQVEESISNGSNSILKKETDYHIRKLTERECFRLMGVSDSTIDKIQSTGISKTQQYKLAGNSIVVDVLYYIFDELFYNPYNIEQQSTLKECRGINIETKLTIRLLKILFRLHIL